MRTLNTNQPARQSGAVLIVAMILLVVLTMLGVTAMNTTSLEERMASNTQEQVRAFQAAETALSEAFNDNNSYTISGTFIANLCPNIAGIPAGVTTADFAGTDNDLSYCTVFMGFSPPPPGSLYSATSFQAAHFNFRSRGTSGSQLTATINGGAYQIAPKM
jgi:type II secretory pathway pseudopilin PulG